MSIQKGTVIAGLNISAMSTTFMIRNIHLEFDEVEVEDGVNATRTKRKVDRGFTPLVRNGTTGYDTSKHKSTPTRKVIYHPTRIRGNLRKS